MKRLAWKSNGAVDMNDSIADTTKTRGGPVYAISIWVLRAIIVLNFIRFALSFSPRFEGTAQKEGAIDRLLGSYTVLGFFRPDFAWLIVSTIVIFAASFYFARISKTDEQARSDVLLCRAWCLAFVVYIVKVILTGVLYPG
jgi:hypothetical protein